MMTEKEARAHRAKLRARAAWPFTVRELRDLRAFLNGGSLFEDETFVMRIKLTRMIRETIFERRLDRARRSKITTIVGHNRRKPR